MNALDVSQNSITYSYCLLRVFCDRGGESAGDCDVGIMVKFSVGWIRMNRLSCRCSVLRVLQVRGGDSVANSV